MEARAQGLVKGWDSISAYTGFSRKVLSRLAGEERFPLTYIAGRPVTTKNLIDGWLEERIRLAVEHGERQ